MVTRLSVAHQRTAQKLMSKRPAGHQLCPQWAHNVLLSGVLTRKTDVA